MAARRTKHKRRVKTKLKFQHNTVHAMIRKNPSLLRLPPEEFLSKMSKKLGLSFKGK